MFYVVERWLGGTLTNFSTIKKSIKRLNLLEKEGSHIYENQTKEVQMLNGKKLSYLTSIKSRICDVCQMQLLLLTQN